MCPHTAFLKIILVFFYMLASLVDDGPDMVIRKRIENGFSLSSALDQLTLL
jgi:hypothetical protein